MLGCWVGGKNSHSPGIRIGGLSGHDPDANALSVVVSERTALAGSRVETDPTLVWQTLFPQPPTSRATKPIPKSPKSPKPNEPSSQQAIPSARVASDAEAPKQQPLPSSTSVSAVDEAVPARAIKSSSTSASSPRAVPVTATTAVQQPEAAEVSRLTRPRDEHASDDADSSVEPCAAERGGDEAAAAAKVVHAGVDVAMEEAAVAEAEAERERRTAAAAEAQEELREEREAVPATAEEPLHATPPPTKKRQQQCDAGEQSRSDGTGEMR